MSDIDHTLTPEIVCPHCGYEHTDSWEWDDDDGEDFCHECVKPFRSHRVVTVEYTTTKQEAQP